MSTALSYLLGALTPPALIFLVWVVGRVLVFCRKWLKPLPILSWPGMILISLGLKLVFKRHCDFKVIDNRIYISPRVKAFKVDK